MDRVWLFVEYWLKKNGFLTGFLHRRKLSIDFKGRQVLNIGTAGNLEASVHGLTYTRAGPSLQLSQ